VQTQINTIKGEVRDLGTVTFNLNGADASCTTAQFITMLTTLGAFNTNHATMKASWDYSGNNDISDTGFGAFELAGCAVETYKDSGGDYHIMVTRPTTGAAGGQILVYNYQGSGYSPGWRQIWTSTTDGSGSGLDADTIDGNNYSSTWPTTKANVESAASAGVNLATSSGNVGIGTTNPLYPLHLYKASDETGILFSYGANGIYLSHGGWGLGAGKIGIGSGSAAVLTVDATNSNVGIGTTAPAAKLESNLGATTGVYPLRLHSSGVYTEIGSLNSSWCHLNTTATSGFYFYDTVQAGAGNHQFAISSGNSYLASAGGNVGIGTTNPTEKLHIVGDVKVDGYLNSAKYVANSSISYEVAAANTEESHYFSATGQYLLKDIQIGAEGTFYIYLQAYASLSGLPMAGVIVKKNGATEDGWTLSSSYVAYTIASVSCVPGDRITVYADATISSPEYCTIYVKNVSIRGLISAPPGWSIVNP